MRRTVGCLAAPGVGMLLLTSCRVDIAPSQLHCRWNKQSPRSSTEDRKANTVAASQKTENALWLCVPKRVSPVLMLGRAKTAGSAVSRKFRSKSATKSLSYPFPYSPPISFCWMSPEMFVSCSRFSRTYLIRQLRACGLPIKIK